MQFYQSYLIQQTDNQQKLKMKSGKQFNEEFQNISDQFSNSQSGSSNDKIDAKVINIEKILKESTKSIISNSTNIINEESKLFNNVKYFRTTQDEISNKFISIDTSINSRNDKQIIK